MKRSRLLAAALSAAALLAAVSNGTAQAAPKRSASKSVQDLQKAAPHSRRPTARPAHAKDLAGKQILMYGPTATGGAEEQVPGATYTIWDAATWASKATTDFAAFDAIVFEDPSCSATPDWAAAITNKDVWGAAVRGNVFVAATDPNFHSYPLLPEDGVTYAATGSGTGLYVSTSCNDDSSATNLLSAVGSFTIESPGDCGSAVHTVWSDPALSDLTDSYLSNWSCSVHAGFTTYPSNYHTFAIDTTSTDNWYTAPDGSTGLPYILISGTGQAAQPVDYVALGDSYSSGEGVTPFYEPTNACHRSTLAYATQIQVPYSNTIFSQASPSSGYTWGFDACSGATTSDVLNKQLSGVSDPSNSNYRALSANTAVVTLTAAGNDMHFADVLSFCGLGHADCSTAAYGGSASLKTWVTKQLPTLKSSLISVYQKIRAEAPNARIVVLDYPQLFPADTANQNCSQLKQHSLRGYSVGFSNKEQNYIRSVQVRVNQTISDAVTAAGVNAEYVSVVSAFTGHEVCGTSGMWVNGPSLQPTNKWPPVKAGQQAFHPTATGQQAYATAVNQYLTPPF